MSYALGAVTLRVYSSRPFKYTNLLSRTTLIGDGTDDAHNEVIQSGALPNRQAQYGIRLYALADVEAIQAMQDTSQVVTFTTRHGQSHEVMVEDFDPTELVYYWTATLTLVEVSLTGES